MQRPAWRAWVRRLFIAGYVLLILGWLLVLQDDSEPIWDEPDGGYEIQVNGYYGWPFFAWSLSDRAVPVGQPPSLVPITYTIDTRGCIANSLVAAFILSSTVFVLRRPKQSIAAAQFRLKTLLLLTSAVGLMMAMAVDHERIERFPIWHALGLTPHNAPDQHVFYEEAWVWPLLILPVAFSLYTACWLTWTAVERTIQRCAPLMTRRRRSDADEFIESNRHTLDGGAP